MSKVKGNSLANAWSYRWLFLNFFQRDITNRYIGSIAGIFWALVQPIAMLVVYTIVFQYIFRVRFPELAGHGFIAFVAVALWPWMAFQEGIQRGMIAIQGGAGLIKKVAFPHEFLVYSAVAATFVVHLTGMLLAMLILSVFETIEVKAQTLPLVLLMLIIVYVLAVGLALLLAALQTLLKDVEHFMAPVFMVLFYASPILYPVTLVPNVIRQVLEVNPLTFLFSRLRDGLLYGQGDIHITDLIALLFSVMACIFARWFFNRLSPVFEDFL